MHATPARATAAALTLLLGLVAASGCSAILGLDDFSGDGGAAGTSGSVASGDASSSRATNGPGSSGSGSGNGSSVSSAAQSGSSAADTSAASTADASSVQSSGNGITCDLPSSCVPDAPVGFNGPYLAARGAPGAPPSCVGDFDQELGPYFTDLDEGVPSCSCSCSAASGIQCSGPARYCFANNCLAACIPTAGQTIPQGGCNNFPGSGTNIQIFPPVPTNHGSCQASLVPNIPTPTWGTMYAGCGSLTLDGGGCGVDELCVPPPIQPFQTRCIVGTGDQVCPNHYTVKTLVRDGFTDGRSCTGCSCGNATSECRGAVTFASDDCGFFVDDVTGCSPFDGAATEDAFYTPAPSGSCPPSGGQVTGSVTLGNVVTFCCEP